MKTTPVKIGGVTLALAFTLDAMAAMQDRMPDFDLNKVTTYHKTPRGLGDMIDCMAQQGVLLEGRELSVSREWIGSHISPSPARVARLQIAVLEAINNGISLENEEETGERDLVLEELKKKDG